MNIRYRCLLILVAGAMKASLLSAQLGFSMPTLMNTSTNQIVNIPVQVYDFDSIASIQFVIKWDPEVLSFLAITGYNLPGLSPDNFGLTQVADSGLVRFLWSSTSGNDLASLPDSAAIFNLRLKVVGQDPSGTDILFTERVPLTFFEVVRQLEGPPFYQIYDLSNTDLVHGFVGVGGYVAAETLEMPVFEATVTSNPVQPGSMLWIDMPYPAPVVIRCTDTSGRIIFSENLSPFAGKHGMEIASRVLGYAGVCYLTIQTPYSVRIIPVLVL